MRLARLSMDCKLWKFRDMRASKLFFHSIMLERDAEERPRLRASWLNCSREKPVLSMRLLTKLEPPPLPPQTPPLPPPSPANQAAVVDMKRESVMCESRDSPE